MQEWITQDEESGDDSRQSTFNSSTEYPVSLKLLTRAEEIKLVTAAQAGDESARNRMLEANIRLVVSVARRYNCRSMALEDLVQEGILGLFEAVKGFNPTRGCKFSTYATYWIRQSITRAIEKQDRMIRLPAYGCDAVRKTERACKELRLSLGREPTKEEIVKHTGLSRRLVDALHTMGPEPLSLDMMVGNDEDTQFVELLEDMDAVEPEDDCIRQFNVDTLVRTLEKLPARECMVIKKRFAIGYDRVYSLREIAEELGMSREGVRHMQNRTLKRLRKMLRNEATFTADHP